MKLKSFKSSHFRSISQCGLIILAMLEGKTCGCSCAWSWQAAVLQPVGLNKGTAIAKPWSTTDLSFVALSSPNWIYVNQWEPILYSFQDGLVITVSRDKQVGVRLSITMLLCLCNFSICVHVFHVSYTTTCTCNNSALHYDAEYWNTDFIELSLY